jgi:hypothetical protein
MQYSVLPAAELASPSRSDSYAPQADGEHDTVVVLDGLAYVIRAGHADVQRTTASEVAAITNQAEDAADWWIELTSK